ncbi:MAG: endonuclease/exonuclease/phosphatase family protein [Erysipelotrichaceae bacterium]|nr:endonuclease/exonuclease/phosphatase family protein [Erysipelotrichaceae bacterium]
MSFNIKNDTIFTAKKGRWPHRFQAINAIIKDNDPDIIGLQEITDQMLKDIDLAQYAWVGANRNKQFNLANEKNIILYKKAKFKAIDQETYWLSKKPEVQGSRVFASIYPRICTYVALEDDQHNIYHIYNTHLDHLLNIVRGKQVQHLCHLIQRNDATHTILMGDFNTDINTKPLQMIMQKLGFKHCYCKFQKLKHTHLNILNKFKRIALPIDYIFISSDMDFTNTKIGNNHINNVYASDHFPIICKIKDVA